MNTILLAVLFIILDVYITVLIYKKAYAEGYLYGLQDFHCKQNHLPDPPRASIMVNGEHYHLTFLTRDNRLMVNLRHGGRQLYEIPFDERCWIRIASKSCHCTPIV